MVAYARLHLRDEIEHVARRRPAGIEDVVGVTIADHGTADAEPLGPGRVDQTAGVVTLRISKDAAGTRRSEGLALRPRAEPGVETRHRLRRGRRVEVQLAVQHDAGLVLQPAVTVPQREI